jgi:phosphoribosylglycinamide formyltransferase-1
MKNIVILISGRGSNMQAIVEAHEAGQLAGGQIAAVVSNRPQAAGLAWAAARGIATAVVDHTTFADRETFDTALADTLNRFNPDLVVLAGFMRILTAGFTQRFAGRMMNIHPSLLPAFTGLHTHERAIATGCKLAGATVHFVTAELDHGPIIAQGCVPILTGDTADTVAARVLKIEHQLYPQAVRWFVQDRLSIDGLQVAIAGEAEEDGGHA